MPVHNFPSQHGALHIKYIVDLPTSLTPAQREGLEKLFPKL